MDADLVIQNRTGLHARPAREFVNLAKTFQADVRVQHGAKKANGKSLVSLLTLGVKRGSTIRLEVQGADEAAALAVLTAAVHAGLGEGTGEGEAAGAPDPLALRQAQGERTLSPARGEPVEPRAVGPAAQ